MMESLFSFSAVLITVLLVHNGSCHDTMPIVNTLTGKVSGIVEQSFEGTDYFSFKGIPFAEPPVGNLRFTVSNLLEFAFKNFNIWL